MHRASRNSRDTITPTLPISVRQPPSTAPAARQRPKRGAPPTSAHYRDVRQRDNFAFCEPSAAPAPDLLCRPQHRAPLIRVGGRRRRDRAATGCPASGTSWWGPADNRWCAHASAGMTRRRSQQRAPTTPEPGGPSAAAHRRTEGHRMNPLNQNGNPGNHDKDRGEAGNSCRFPQLHVLNKSRHLLSSGQFHFGTSYQYRGSSYDKRSLRPSRANV